MSYGYVIARTADPQRAGCCGGIINNIPEHSVPMGKAVSGREKYRSRYQILCLFWASLIPLRAIMRGTHSGSGRHVNQ